MSPAAEKAPYGYETTEQLLRRVIPRMEPGDKGILNIVERLKTVLDGAASLKMRRVTLEDAMALLQIYYIDRDKTNERSDHS